jgi:hypothetical protein
MIAAKGWKISEELEGAVVHIRSCATVAHDQELARVQVSSERAAVSGTKRAQHAVGARIVPQLDILSVLLYS